MIPCEMPGCGFKLETDADFQLHMLNKHPWTKRDFVPALSNGVDLALLARLRSMGVARFKGVGMEVDFFPPGGGKQEGVDFVTMPAPNDGPPAPLDLGEPEKCRCGHEETSHAGEGYCLLGCPVESCVDKQPQQAT